MRYMDRILIGIILILLGFLLLWYGSPARSPAAEPNPIFAWAFVLFFALGFIIGSMALLGSEDQYPAFLSGMVLYFIIGGLIAVILYVTGNGIGGWTLYDADNPGFWAAWGRLIVAWPLELIRSVGVLGYGDYGLM